ncbi:MAG: AbrB/MazE/SpoVT family DNA-binding domain-containing protein [Thermomicrobiales bacterium]
MKEIISTITSKGQVTIPSEVRKELGIGTRDKIAFVIDEGAVHLRPVKYATLESVFGSIPPLDRPTTADLDAEIDEAKGEAIAHKVERWSRG